MNSIETIISNATNITVIDDGQVSYPVLTSELRAFIDSNGEIDNGNYEAFCQTVDYLGQQAGSPGNSGMIELCSTLVAAGADSISL